MQNEPFSVIFVFNNKGRTDILFSSYRINSMKSSWRQITSSVAQGSILSSVLFNICIKHLDDGAECTLNKYPDGTKLGGVADALEGYAASQKDLSRLEKCTDRNFTKFSKERCKVLHLGRNNPQHQYLLGGAQLQRGLAEQSCVTGAET